MNPPTTSPAKCRCQSCDGHIEFDPVAAGQSIACPHCGLETRLYVPGASRQRPIPSQPVFSKRKKWAAIAAVTMVVLIAIGSWCGLKVLELTGVALGGLTLLAMLVFGILCLITLFLWIVFPVFVFLGMQRFELLLKEIERNTRSPLLAIGCLLFVISSSAQQPDPYTARYGSLDGKIKPTPPAVAKAAQAAQDLRVVEAKLYDASKSVLWKTLSGECLEVRTNGVLIQEIIVHRVTAPDAVNYAQSIGAYGSAPGRHTISESRERGKAFFLRNYPLTLRPAAGQTLTAKALRVGTITIDTEPMELWDFGTVYTAPRALPASRTNSPPSAIK